jgi:predicted transcriptional regulator
VIAVKAQINIELDEELLSALDRIALSEFKTREALIHSAIVSYVERLTQMEELKSLAMDRYLKGELNFDDFARIVGYERAVLARDIDQAMKESIEHAREDFAHWEA